MITLGQTQVRVIRGIMRTAWFGLTCAFAGCSGSGASGGSLPTSSVQPVLISSQPQVPIVSQTPTASQTQAAAQPVPVQLQYRLPSAGSSTESRAKRRLQYVSVSNTLISVTVTPLGGGSTNFGPTACTTSTCVINFTANPGPNTIAFSLTDGTNVLSRFSTTTIVAPSVANSLKFTANPVVSSVVLNLASASINAGVAFDSLLSVDAKDADGNTIVGTGNYVDVNGNSLSLLLNVTTARGGGKGTVSITGSTRITSPGQALTSIHYDGGWLDHADISVSATSNAAISFTPATLTAAPTVIEYATPTGGSDPEQIITGPDGNLWFTERGTSKIGRTTLNGVMTEFTIPTASSGPIGIASGPDGNLWFTERDGGKIGRITTAGTITEYTGLTGNTPVDMIAGVDGNLWFTEHFSNKIAYITTSGSVHEFAIPSANVWSYDITNGPDGNFWFSENNGNSVGRITPQGVITEFPLPTSGAGSFGITSGPDGALWVCESNAGKIARVSTNGTVTEYSAGMTAGANPQKIVTGPDGNLWFTEGSDRIGRITTSGVITEFSSGITAGSFPRIITVGLDGNLWFTEAGGNRIAKFIF